MEMQPALPLTAGKLHDDKSGEVFALPELSVIGRRRESVVPVADPRVSRRHAMIRRQDDRFWLDTSPASRLAALKAAHAMRVACDEVQQEHGAVLGPLGLRFGSGAAVHMGPATYGAFSPREFTLMGDAVVKGRDQTVEVYSLERDPEKPLR